MKKKERIIIFGGSFDPPHEGHRRLAVAALRRLGPSRLYLLPAFRSPFKDGHGASFADRAAMLRALFRGERRASVSELERRRGRVTYTWQALRHFRRLHPKAELYFLMGSDCLEGFPRWRRPGEVLASARLLAGRRPGPFRAPRGVPWELLPGVFPDEASSSLRAALYSGDALERLPPPVSRVIEKRGLYLAGLRRRLKRLSSAKRYRHMLSSAGLAAELAFRHGLDPLRAAQAALIHDAARDWPPQKLRAWALRARPPMPNFRETLAKAPQLFHGAAAAALAPRLLGVKDPAVLRAARLHTLGSAGMTRLDKLVYLADAASPDRDFPAAARIRRLAFRDLDRAFVLANRIKLRYIFKCKKWAHPAAFGVCRELTRKN